MNRSGRTNTLSRLAGFLLACLAVAPQPSSATGPDFHFYVLALSWSPSFCALEGEAANAMQCGSRSDYGFVVHGLWPQFERGYPEFCETDWPGRLPRSLGEAYFDIMPGMGLIGHQWRKHGSCTGLSPADYLALTRRASSRITVPEDLAGGGGMIDAATVEARFAAANPGLSSDAIAVACTRGHLREVRICLTTDLEFRSCPEVDARGCTSQSLEMPPR